MVGKQELALRFGVGRPKITKKLDTNFKIQLKKDYKSKLSIETAN